MMPRSDSSIPGHVQVTEDTFDNNMGDDDSSVVSGDIPLLEDDISLCSDLDTDSDNDFGLDFLLDIGVLESDRLHQIEHRRRARRSLLEGEDDPLETDSLTLIRRRVPHQPLEATPVVEAAKESIQSFSPSVVKKSDSALAFQMCEVPLGVSLKDIIPSSLFRKQNFADLIDVSTRSDSLLDGIDKALEILSI